MGNVWDKRSWHITSTMKQVLASDLDHLKYPNDMSLRCLSVIPKLSLVSELYECVCMMFCWAPAELLLLFLPPKTRADSLSKQALSLPTDGGRVFRADAVGLHFFYPLWNACK